MTIINVAIQQRGRKIPSVRRNRRNDIILTANAPLLRACIQYEIIILPSPGRGYLETNVIPTPGFPKISSTGRLPQVGTAYLIDTADFIAVVFRRLRLEGLILLLLHGRRAHPDHWRVVRIICVCPCVERTDGRHQGRVRSSTTTTGTTRNSPTPAHLSRVERQSEQECGDHNQRTESFLRLPGLLILGGRAVECCSLLHDEIPLWIIITIL